MRELKIARSQNDSLPILYDLLDTVLPRKRKDIMLMIQRIAERNKDYDAQLDMFRNMAVYGAGFHDPELIEDAMDKIEKTEGRLSCQLYQRSGDVFLGVPFNIASYALLTAMVAQVCGLKPGTFVHTLGDAHLYANHLEQARLQLTRTPFPLPTLELNPNVRNLDDFTYEDIRILNYQAHPHIKADVAV